MVLQEELGRAVRFTLVLPSDLYAGLKKKAAGLGESMQSVIRQALREFLEK